MATPTLPVAPGSQLFSQSVTVTDLSLVSVRYRITVSAATQAGTGPESDPVFVGTQAPGQHDSVLYNAMLQCKKYTMLLYYTTVSIGIIISVGYVTILLYCFLLSEPEVDSQSSRTEEYYVVRILPPLVGVAFIAVTVVILLVFCWQRRTLHTRKKGLYQCE